MKNYILRSENYDILYIPSPKCAHTSVLNALFYLDHGEWYESYSKRENIKYAVHRYYDIKLESEENGQSTDQTQ